ncbi:MAG: LPS-assembly protein LptD [Magnetococcales bacterium]|nr:LPS-assembly protein LptD [Magnetococcales bacterium]
MVTTDPFFPKKAAKLKKTRGILSALCIVITASAASQLHSADLPIDIDADKLNIDNATQDMVASGNVVVEQKGMFKLQADSARYHGEENVITADGSIKLSHKGDKFLGDKIRLNISTNQGEMDNVTIDLAGPGGRGGAQKIELTGEKNLEMTDGWYTNCDCEDPPWHLSAKKISVDNKANRVIAKGVKLNIKDTPVAYFPWWSQPLRQERSSGFLTPSIRFSGSNGSELETPYFWNIAPDKDMTVALRGITKRGLMGKVEYRYIGLGYEGQFSTNQIFDTKDDQFRGLTTFSHEHRVGGWDFSAGGEYSKTRDFINDFEQDLVDESAKRLESHLSIDRQWINQNGYSDAQAGMLWYQDLEKSNDDVTIQSLPYIYLSDNRPISGKDDGRRWRLQSDAKIDSFYQSSGDAVQRLDLAPTVRYNRPLDIGNFSAQAGVRETAYLIQGDPNQSGNDHDSTEHREASMLSFRLDTQLSKHLSDTTQHTIEPSIEYVVNASTDQGKLPNYDSTLRNFNTSNLFVTDQYSGSDRISNGQWISYGITSRLISLVPDDSLMETATFKIGQRWAPSGDREYQNDKATSSIVSSLDLSFTGGWSAHANNRYDPHEEEINRTDAEIIYTKANRDRASLGYHYNQPSTLALAEDGSEKMEDITLSSLLHLSDEWLYTQTANYSLESSRIKSWESSMEYIASCWSLGLKVGRNLSADVANDDYNGSYFGLIFSLKGLGGYGK